MTTAILLGLAGTATLAAVIGGFIVISRLKNRRYGVPAPSERDFRSSDALVAGMSHEIRTPMNAILGMTSLLRNTALDDQQRQYLDLIRTSSEHLLGLINDILDYARIAAGELELKRQAFNLRETIEEAMDIVAAKAVEVDKRLELAQLCDASVPVALTGDAMRVRQVLLNLLSNAVKFTHEGEVAVEATTAAMRNGQHQVQIAVRDSGIGIPQDQIGRLFKPFAQAEAAAHGHYGGSGLGLAISMRLAQAMGGTITVESRVGHGSVFRFSFIAAAEDSAAAPPNPVLAGKRVLIVDDNPTTRRFLRASVNALGMEAQDTGSPVEALSWIGSQPPDVALVDRDMPDTSGIALARDMRKLRAARELPIIILLPYGQALADSAGSDADFQAALTKPINATQLQYRLVNVLRHPESSHLTREKHQETTTLDYLPRIAALRILIADDTQTNRTVARLLLERLGHEADVVADGSAAVAAVTNKEYDIVFMDLSMPGMNGLQATRRIRDTLPRLRQPRIIAMTAHALPEDREQCLAAGMDDYISKPVRPQELSAALVRWVGAKRR